MANGGIQVENLSQLQQKMRRIHPAVRDAAVEVIQDAGVRVRDAARENVRDREIAPTIKKRRLAKGLDAKVRVTHWRAAMEEFGTKPHVIEPTTKKALASTAGLVSFQGEDAFGPVGRVRHPGQDPHPFLQPAAERELRDVPRRLARATRDATRKVARGQ